MLQEVCYYPVTQEALAHRCSEGTASDDDKAILCEAVKKMIIGLANKHNVNLKEDVEDLLQQSFEKIWGEIGKYDYTRGKFTTWAYCITQNAYNQSHRKNKRFRENIKIVRHGENENDEIKTSFIESLGMTECLKKEIKTTIIDLYENNPEIHDVLDAFFGNPSNEHFQMPTSFSIQDAVHKVGRKYSDVYEITCNIIRPAFSKVSLN